jgi:outer membrane protein assembly factor BamE (lipoprotein component of BamABCDE complex)
MKELCLGLIILMLASCAAPTPVSDRNSDLTQGNVQMNLTVGETTKAQVLEVFGAPNVTTRDSSSHEVWTYQRQAQVAQSSSRSSGWTVIFGGSSSSSSGFESSSRMMTLIIRFDENDVVSDFRSRASNF